MSQSDEPRRPTPGLTSATGRSLVCRHCGAPLHGDPSCPSCGEQFRIDEAQAPLSGLVEEMRERLAKAVKGRYELRGLLGHGGMGAVFLAVELRLDRLVAIKVLPPTLSRDEALLTRFEREARTAARLDHPGIVPIYSVEDSNDLHFFVMKFVPGSDLTEEIEQGPMPVERVREILLAAARALSHAHDRGVIHRDVKPSNIMIDDEGRVVLADFGIAKAAASSQVTSTGQTLGSPQYMSPEQFEGREVDGRSDQYGLGMVAYHMLVGHAPFEGGSYGSILIKQVMEYPTPLTEERPDLPPDLVAAVERAIRKDPEERFPDMEAFAAAVSGAAGTTARGARGASNGSARPVSSAGPAPSRSRDRLVAALGTLVVLAGLGYAVLGNGSGGDDASSEGVDPVAGVPTAAATEGAGDGEGAGAEATQGVTADPGGGGTGVQTGESGDPGPGDAGEPGERDAGSTRIGADVDSRESTADPGDPVRAPASGQAATPTPETRPPPAAATPVNGLLTINAQPVYAYVEVDGIELPNSTPIFQHALPPGRHVLTVRRAGYQTVVDTVDVTAGNETRRSYVLIAN